MAEGAFDVVVIGSGPGGGSVALALSLRGIKVLVLEAGPAYDYTEDYRLDQNDWENHKFPATGREKESHTFAPMQKLDPKWADLMSWNRLFGPTNKSDRRAVGGYYHVQGVGGSTLHYSGEAHRLHADAFNMRSSHGVAADWPFGYNELEPYYAEAERIIGVAGPASQTGRQRSAPFPLPAHRLSYASRKIAQGCESLGLTLAPNSVGILSEAYGDRPPCNYCANCARGCPRADKGSVDVTFIAQALETGNCTLRPESPVVRIEVGKNDLISSVVYADANGDLNAVSARSVVVACGAVNTPRLLLASAGQEASDGLANESGHVGRNFMETSFWTSSALHSEPLGSHRGVPLDATCWNFNAPDSIPGVVGGCRFSAGAAEAGLNGPFGYATRVVGGWGRAHKARMRETFGSVLTITSIGEFLPNAGTFVDLDANKTDRNGVPLARIHSQLEEMDIHRVAFMAKTAREILRASGAGEPFEEYGTYDYFQSTHVFGTCRMGSDPESSVLNPVGRSHRWRNLYISDASVFPSSGGGEAPSLTIEALGIRTAANIAEDLRRGDI